jgi:hypothetical protein
MRTVLTVLMVLWFQAASAYGTQDLLEFLSNYGCITLSGDPSACNDLTWDLNGDYQINCADLLIILSEWGQ